MNWSDPLLTILATEARVKTPHIFHLIHALKDKRFHKEAFAQFAGLESHHIDRMLAALEAHGAMPTKAARGSSGKTMLPKDWQPPKIDDLPPKSQALARQWTAASYATQAEGFVLFWTNARRMMVDWNATWANRIIQMHSTVMRDQKFGNAPTDNSKSHMTAEWYREQALFFDSIGQRDKAQDMRREAAKVDNVVQFKAVG